MFEISGIGVVAVLAAGAISFLSPCVLPLVPGYLSYVAGAVEGGADRPSRLDAIGAAFAFVLGFSTVFVALGAGASAISRILLAYRSEAAIVGGIVIIVFGLFTTGVLRLSWLQRDVRFHGRIPGGRSVAAYLMGIAFAFGWTPCIGPILGSILSLSAVTTTIGSGVFLLSIYALGLAVPFLAAAIFAERATVWIRGAGKLGRRLNIAAGAIMVIMGVAMVTGQLSAFSFWLLDTFPVFGRIG